MSSSSSSINSEQDHDRDIYEEDARELRQNTGSPMDMISATGPNNYDFRYDCYGNFHFIYSVNVNVSVREKKKHSPFTFKIEIIAVNSQELRQLNNGVNTRLNLTRTMRNICNCMLKLNKFLDASLNSMKAYGMLNITIQDTKYVRSIAAPISRYRYR